MDEKQVKEIKKKNQSRYLVARMDECISEIDGNAVDRKTAAYQALLDKYFDKKPVLVFEQKGEKFIVFER